MAANGLIWKAQVAHGPMGLTMLSIGRTDQPEVFPMPLTPEHLVMTNMLHIGDRVQLRGEGEVKDTTWVITDVPSTEQWADPKAQMTLRSEADNTVMTRVEIESIRGQRGLENWTVWERSEGWVPLSLVGERLVAVHQARDTQDWLEQVARMQAGLR